MTDICSCDLQSTKYHTYWVNNDHKKRNEEKPDNTYTEFLRILEIQEKPLFIALQGKSAEKN